MKLNDFLEQFDEITNVEVREGVNILIKCNVGDVPQRILNCRFVEKCMVDNAMLIINTSLKIQEEIELIEEA